MCLQVIIRLNKGLGISLVDRTPEELVYVLFNDVAVEYMQENEEKSLRADVRSLQVTLSYFSLHMNSVPTHPEKSWKVMEKSVGTVYESQNCAILHTHSFAHNCSIAHFQYKLAKRY